MVPNGRIYWELNIHQLRKIFFCLGYLLLWLKWNFYLTTMENKEKYDILHPTDKFDLYD